MKTLQEIKDEYAKENSYDNWEDLTSTYKYSIFKYQDHLNEVSHRYALEVARETQRRCAENAKTKLGKRQVGNLKFVLDEVVDKSSILDPKNLAI